MSGINLCYRLILLVFKYFMYGTTAPVQQQQCLPFHRVILFSPPRLLTLYPPADQCSYTAEAYVIYDGQQCVSSSRQEQNFSAWARDNENGAVIITDPVVAQFCEGEDIIDVRFEDNSTFNCNINIEPDKPNRITRWVQFIYGTTSIGGDRIPNITIRDPLGQCLPNDRCSR